MKKLLIIGTLLLLCVFGAGCVNTEITEPGKTIPNIPAEDHPPVTLQPIVGEWEGYDAQTKTTYEATFLYDGYAKLEIETEQPGEDRESILFGAWEGNSPNYQIKLNLGNYTLTILEEGKSAKLTTPDNRAVTLSYESF